MESHNRAVKAAALKRSAAASAGFQSKLELHLKKLASANELPALLASKKLRREVSSLRDECLSDRIRLRKQASAMAWRVCPGIL